MPKAAAMRRGRTLLPVVALAALACVAAWHSAGSLFASPGGCARPGAAAGAPAAAASAAAAPAPRGALVARRAAEADAEARRKRKLEYEDEDLPVRRNTKWEAPFPKYMVGSMILFGTIGYFGGGWILAGVFGVSGLGFGLLFEPFQNKDGTISGLD
mmetsp:Transcript_105419/g.328618  ORF Transcript_105419/g.328618 Transcript_105419/m.328618 type:complete len:157 (-) Transcript_105419:66-536(-)